MTTTAEPAANADNAEAATENAPTAAVENEELTPEQQLAALTAKYEALKKDSRKWESRATSNSTKAKQWDEYEESKKPVEQRNAERLAALEKENQELKLDKVKTRIALTYGFDEKAMQRLRGSTEEELEADAKDLKELLGTKIAPTKPPVLPVATQGIVPGSTPTGGKAKTYAELIARLDGKK